MIRRNFPAPIFLIRLENFDVPIDQLHSKPSRQVLSKTTRINKVFSHLRQVEAASLEKNVQSVISDEG